MFLREINFLKPKVPEMSILFLNTATWKMWTFLSLVSLIKYKIQKLNIFDFDFDFDFDFVLILILILILIVHFLSFKIKLKGVEWKTLAETPDCSVDCYLSMDNQNEELCDETPVKTYRFKISNDDLYEEMVLFANMNRF